METMHRFGVKSIFVVPEDLLFSYQFAAKYQLYLARDYDIKNPGQAEEGDEQDY